MSDLFTPGFLVALAVATVIELVLAFYRWGKALNEHEPRRKRQ